MRTQCVRLKTWRECRDVEGGRRVVLRQAAPRPALRVGDCDGTDAAPVGGVMTNAIVQVGGGGFVVDCTEHGRVVITAAHQQHMPPISTSYGLLLC
jgi:hypothetical protein